MIIILCVLVFAVIVPMIAATRSTRDWTPADWERAYARQARIAELNAQTHPWKEAR